METKQRFDEKWEKDESGCWIWVAGEKHGGYGGFYMNGIMVGAHRASYILHEGEISDDKYVLHTCDVKKCVNPDHLYTGTQQENINDALERGQINFGMDNHSTKVSDDEVHEIRYRYDNEDISQSELSKDYSITQSMVSRIVNENRREKV